MPRWSPRKALRVAEVVRALWFVPALMTTAGVALGFAMPRIDAIPHVLATFRFGWVTSVLESAPVGSQQLLATSAGALATVLGVVFSLTLVTLQLATAQYTPRIIGQFLDDRVTKIVLGAYLGTVAYLLLVLRSVRGASDDVATFVPRLSILLALVLILSCLGLLAYFVHHLSQSIQAANVGARVVRTTIRALHRLDPHQDAVVCSETPASPPDSARVVCDVYGYVQRLDVARLAAATPRSVGAVRVDVAAGDYVLQGTPIATLWPCRELSRRESAALLDAIALGPHRTDDQDVLFGVRQLVDIGLKALSPSVNDETTAITIINQLATVIAAAGGDVPGTVRWRRWDADGICIFTPSLTIERLIEDAFAGLIRFSVDHPRVLARAVEVLADLATRQSDPERRRAITAPIAWVTDILSTARFADHERLLVERRLVHLRNPRVPAPADRPHAMH
jgi:uncharacterized membrane protein